MFKSLEGPVDNHCFEERNNVYIIKTLTDSNGQISDLRLFVPLDLDLRINNLLQSDSFNTPTYHRDSKLITSTSKHPTCYIIEAWSADFPGPTIKLQIEKSTDGKPFVPSYPMLISLEPLALAFSNENDIFVVKDASKFANN